MEEKSLTTSPAQKSLGSTVIQSAKNSNKISYQFHVVIRESDCNDQSISSFDDIF